MKEEKKITFWAAFFLHPCLLILDFIIWHKLEKGMCVGGTRLQESRIICPHLSSSSHPRTQQNILGMAPEFPNLNVPTVSVLCSLTWCFPTGAAPHLTQGRGPRKASSDQQCSWYKWPRRMCSPDTYAAVGTQSSPAYHMSGTHKLGTATSQHASSLQGGHLGHPRKAFPMGFPGPLCLTSH